MREVHSNHEKSEFGEVLTNLTRTATEVENELSGGDPPGEGIEDPTIERETEDIASKCLCVVLGDGVVCGAHGRDVEWLHHQKSVLSGLLRRPVCRTR